MRKRRKENSIYVTELNATAYPYCKGYINTFVLYVDTLISVTSVGSFLWRLYKEPVNNL